MPACLRHVEIRTERTGSSLKVATCGLAATQGVGVVGLLSFFVSREPLILFIREIFLKVRATTLQTTT